MFGIARLFSTKKRLTNLNGEQNDTWNLLVSHRICHFRAVQSFDELLVVVFLVSKHSHFMKRVFLASQAICRDE